MWNRLEEDEVSFFPTRLLCTTPRVWDDKTSHPPCMHPPPKRHSAPIPLESHPPYKLSYTPDQLAYHCKCHRFILFIHPHNNNSQDNTPTSKQMLGKVFNELHNIYATLVMAETNMCFFVCFILLKCSTRTKIHYSDKIIFIMKTHLLQALWLTNNTKPTQSTPPSLV